MAEDDKKRDPKEEEVVRSPLQVAIRVFLALLMIALLVGFILAIVLRPEEVLEPETRTAPAVLARSLL